MIFFFYIYKILLILNNNKLMSELTEEQRRKNMRRVWKAKLSTNYFSKGKHPDEQIIQEIKSRGLDKE
jgi:hypothetical protein